jgi:hypothetical protein
MQQRTSSRTEKEEQERKRRAEQKAAEKLEREQLQKVLVLDMILSIATFV